MNRYPLWKYLIILVALVLGALYTLPNFYGESPAIQVSSARATMNLDSNTVERVGQILKDNNLAYSDLAYEPAGGQGAVRVRFASTDTQFKAKTVLENALDPDPSQAAYSVSYNLTPNTPAWLQKIYASPMYLGLDLRGGVHFLMQVDTQSVINRRLEGVQGQLRTQLREKNIRYSSLDKAGSNVIVALNDDSSLDAVQEMVRSSMPDLVAVKAADRVNTLQISLNPQQLKQTLDDAVGQNISTLSKRVNELGVAEPVIQRQGADRIVVELPGVQDVTRAKDIIGRTATLEVRLVDETITRGNEASATIPFGSELFTSGRGAPVVLYRSPVLTGEYITNASASFDQNQQSAVSVSLNSAGGALMRQATRNKIGHGMAIVLFEKGRGEVLTVANIVSELGSNFQITGMGSAQSAADLSLLLRAGSLAAPMDIVEERTIGPQLGADNITKGFDSVLYGFVAIAVFMILYYLLFGLFSVLALSVNLLLLVSILSMLQATLTLPGIAAIALTLGMAIDANVLINERIREELRNGNTPQAALAAGFDRAWGTILDSNVTTLIAGLALLIFGSGAIRGFAVVHCLGIVTSIFSSVFFSRGLANLWYGRRRKLAKLSIGQVWKPSADEQANKTGKTSNALIK